MYLGTCYADKPYLYFENDITLINVALSEFLRIYRINTTIGVTLRPEILYKLSLCGINTYLKIYTIFLSKSAPLA